MAASETGRCWTTLGFEGATLLLALLVWPGAVRAEFKFQVPPGWTDLSPGAPDKNFEGLPPEMKAQVRNGAAVFFAADLTSVGGGFVSNVNAVIQDGSGELSDELLQELATRIDAEVKQQMPGTSYSVVDHRLVQIHDVACGRIVGVLNLGQVVTKQVAFLLPGGDKTAVLTFSTTPEDFPRYEATFDAAATATQGLAAPSGFWSKVFSSSSRGAIIGGGAALAAVLIAALLRRRRTA